MPCGAVVVLWCAVMLYAHEVGFRAVIDRRAGASLIGTEALAPLGIGWSSEVKGVPAARGGFLEKATLR